MDNWTNDAAIQQWGAYPREVLDTLGPEGDFAKQHLLNPVLLRLLGDVRGRRIMDAGCGHGYFSRMLAERGASVTGVEPARSLYAYATEKEAEDPRGIRYVQADLSAYVRAGRPALPDLGGPFDAVVCSMVLMAIPDWAAAMRACAEALTPDGLFVFAIIHPCFERLSATWREHGEYRVREYLGEYEIAEKYASDFHRPLSAYLNEVARLGCRLTEIAEPALDPAVVAAEGIGEEYVRLPNFLVVAASRSLANRPARPSRCWLSHSASEVAPPAARSGGNVPAGGAPERVAAMPRRQTAVRQESASHQEVAARQAGEARQEVRLGVPEDAAGGRLGQAEGQHRSP